MQVHDIQPDSPTLRISPLESDTDLDDFFAAMAIAIQAGDARAARRFWAVPAISMNEAGIQTVGSEGEVLRWFADAKERAFTRGAHELRAEIKRVQWIADNSALVEVRLPYVGRMGEEIEDETITFALRRDDEGSLRIHAALHHGRKRLFH